MRISTAGYRHLLALHLRLHGLRSVAAPSTASLPHQLPLDTGLDQAAAAHHLGEITSTMGMGNHKLNHDNLNHGNLTHTIHHIMEECPSLDPSRHPP